MDLGEPPKHVRLTATQLQTLRGGLNMIEELALRTPHAPVGRVFDPTRIQILRRTNDILAGELEALAPDGSTSMRFAPEEQILVRSAMGAIENMLTDGSPLLEGMMIQPSREDIPRITAIVEAVPVPDLEDVAFADTRQPLFYRAWEAVEGVPKPRVFSTARQEAERSLSQTTSQTTGEEYIDMLLNETRGEYGFGSPGTFSALASVAWKIARGVPLRAGPRQRVADSFTALVEDGIADLDSFEDITAIDEERIRAGSELIAVAVRDGELSFEPFYDYVDMVEWAWYRTEAGFSVSS